MITIGLIYNEQVYYEKLTNTFLTINKFIERNEKNKYEYGTIWQYKIV